MSDNPSTYGYGSEFASWSPWGKGLHLMTHWSVDQVTYASIDRGTLPQCNFNRVGNREPDNLDAAGLLSPFVDGGGVLHIHDSLPVSPPLMAHFNDTGTEVIACDGGVYARAGYTSEPQSVTEDARNTAWRDAGQCTWINTSGTPLSDAVRIPHDENGCHDCVPGVFGIVFVDDSIVQGVSARVRLVHGQSWYRAWYKEVYPAAIHSNKCSSFCYFDLEHPYIDPNAEITVSLASGNANKHVIPGVSIAFNPNPDPGSKATIAVGWEYVDSQVNVIYDHDYQTPDVWYYTGTNFGGPAFVPLSAFGPRNRGTHRPFHLSYGEGPDPYFVAMNNAGELLTGCKIKLMPFCLLDQGRAVTPFDSWFQGGGTEPTAATGEYTVMFKNVRTGSPTTVDLQCSGSLNRDIWAVNESDYSLGQKFYDGEGLLADGSTLYHWPTMGVYFRLATDIENYASATVTVFDDKLVFTDSSQFVAKDIGRWGKTVGELTCNGFWYTGQLQTQGYEVDFFDENIDPVRSKWYNHFDGVSFATTSVLGSPLAENRRYYTGIQLYCDDPRYFCFVPLTFFSHGDNSISSPNPKYRALCGDQSQVNAAFSARVGEPDHSLVMRVQSIPSGMKAKLDELGVTRG